MNVAAGLTSPAPTAEVNSIVSQKSSRRVRPALTLASLVGASAGAAILALHIPRIGRMPHPVGWLVAVSVVSIGVSYLSAAVGLRAAVGTSLPLGRTVLAQLAAALANRITPAGLGGAAVNVRYLTKHGTPAPTATAAVASVAVANSAASLCFALVFVPFAASSSLVSHHVVPLLAVGAVLGLAAAVGVVIGRNRFPQQGRRWAAMALHTVTELRRDPLRLATLVAGSLGVKATHVLALLAALAAFDSDVQLPVAIGVYVVGSAIGSAVPTPNGLGTTEAALVAGLVAAGGSITPVVAGVLVFRLASFWFPILPGAAATWRLKHSHAL